MILGVFGIDIKDPPLAADSASFKLIKNQPKEVSG
jgi:hypothetical protein